MYETDLANNFGLYFKKYKKKLSKPMQDAIVKGNKHSAKEYAEALDFMKRSYESYEEVFEDYHGVLSPASPGVAPKSLKQLVLQNLIKFGLILELHVYHFHCYKVMQICL